MLLRAMKWLPIQQIVVSVYTKTSCRVTVSSKIMFSFQPNKLEQIYVKWYIKTYILGNVSACSVGRKTYCTNSTLCSVYKKRKEDDILKKEDQYDHMMIQIWMPSRWTCSEPMIFLFRERQHFLGVCSGTQPVPYYVAITQIFNCLL